jgi:hypothetical protein
LLSLIPVPNVDSAISPSVHTSTMLLISFVVSTVHSPIFPLVATLAVFHIV